MSVKYGFVYIWRDRGKNRYYIGSHWGTEDDGYICSSNWMQNSFRQRPQDFKRRIIKRIFSNREDLLNEEFRYLTMIKNSELATFNTTTKKRETVKYYNLSKVNKKPWHMYPEHIKTIGQKISLAKRGKNTGPRDPSVGEAISKAKKGRFSDKQKAALEILALKNIGTTHTEERKKAASERTKKQWEDGIRHGVKLSEEQKNNLKEIRKKQGQKLAQSYILTDPTGVEFSITNLTQWCKENNLFASNFCKVLNGTSEHYKGYKIKKI